MAPLPIDLGSQDNASGMFASAFKYKPKHPSPLSRVQPPWEEEDGEPVKPGIPPLLNFGSQDNAPRVFSSSFKSRPKRPSSSSRVQSSSEEEDGEPVKLRPLPPQDFGSQDNAPRVFSSGFKSKPKRPSPRSRVQSSSEEEDGESVKLKPLPPPDPGSFIKTDTPSSRFPSTGLSRPWYKAPSTAPAPKPEKEVDWEFPGLTNTDEYKELTLNPWSYRRKRSLEGQGSPTMAVNGTFIGAQEQGKPGKCVLTATQEISLLVFTWLAALLICGVIVWIMAKIERKLYHLVDRGMMGIEEKKGWRKAMHCAGYSSVVVAIIAMLLVLIYVMFSLKELLGGAIWNA